MNKHDMTGMVKEKSIKDMIRPKLNIQIDRTLLNEKNYYTEYLKNYNNIYDKRTKAVYKCLLSFIIYLKCYFTDDYKKLNKKIQKLLMNTSTIRTDNLFKMLRI